MIFVRPKCAADAESQRPTGQLSLTVSIRATAETASSDLRKEAKPDETHQKDFYFPFSMAVTHGSSLPTLHREPLLLNYTPDPELSTWAVLTGTANIFFQHVLGTGDKRDNGHRDEPPGYGAAGGVYTPPHLLTNSLRLGQPHAMKGCPRRSSNGSFL